MADAVAEMIKHSRRETEQNELSQQAGHDVLNKGEIFGAAGSADDPPDKQQRRQQVLHRNPVTDRHHRRQLWSIDQQMR